MKVKTNAGEIELTPDMVRRGMVFCAVTGARATYVSDWSGTFAREWAEGHYVALLGCDPTLAARGDCERYGIAPGIDAGAHGFARLRNGGAVDLYDEAPIGMVYEYDGTRRVRLARAEGRSPRVYPLSKFDRFVGLDMRHARAEDVERLCCGARLAAYDDRLPAELRCTLAIGDHAEHEDLATGARWPERVWSSAGTRQWTSALMSDASLLNSAEDVDRLFGKGSEFGGQVKTAMRATDAAREMVVHVPAFGQRVAFCGQDDDGSYVTHATLTDDGAFSCACGSTDPAEHAAGCRLPWQDRMAARWAREHLTPQEGLTGAVARGMFGACAVALLAWCVSSVGHSERERRRKEGTLVALVNAVPDGLDAIGWRAAMLAATERGDVRDLNTKARAQIVALLRSGAPVPRGSLTCVVLAVVAYRRAIEPHKAPPRQPLTWKRRGPALPVDDGRDE